MIEQISNKPQERRQNTSMNTGKLNHKTIAKLGYNINFTLIYSILIKDYLQLDIPHVKYRSNQYLQIDFSLFMNTEFTNGVKNCS